MRHYRHDQLGGGLAAELEHTEENMSLIGFSIHLRKLEEVAGVKTG